MKVLFISSSRKGNGLSPFIRAQRNSLIDKGIQINVFLIRRKGLRGYIQALRILRKEYAKSDFDIIHAHYGYSGIIARLAFIHKPLVVSFLGDDLMGNVNEKGSYTFKSKVITFFIRLFACFSFDFNIVKSKRLQNRLLSKKKSAVIPNGIDFQTIKPVEQDFARESLGVNPGDAVVLFPGDPDRAVKNYPLFKSAVEKLDNQNRIKVLVLKNVDPKQVPLYYSAADVTVLTSVHEGSPNVIKEAMACNCPIVSTDVGDVKEIIQNTDGCYLAESSPDGLAEKIKLALKFNTRTNGRENILWLDSSKIAERIMQIYESLIR